MPKDAAMFGSLTIPVRVGHFPNGEFFVLFPNLTVVKPNDSHLLISHPSFFLAVQAIPFAAVRAPF